MQQANAVAIRAAEAYESFLVPSLFDPWARLLVARSGLERGESVLDVACGTGIVARHAAPLVTPDGIVAALDANPAMIHVGRSRAEATNVTVDWREGNALSLPYDDGTFDVVLCQQGLQFFEDQRGALAEMRRVLKPRGRAAVAVWQSLDRHPIYNELNDSIARRTGVAAYEVPFSLGDANRLRTLFHDAGFGDVDLREEEQRVRFPSPDEFVRLSVHAAAAAVPAFAAMDEAARDALAHGVHEDVAQTLRTHIEGTELVEQTAALIVIAHH